MKTNCYPTGVEVIQSGRCPMGAVSPMACMFCPTGHMLECHHPYDCETAQCAHLAAYGNPEDPADFGLDPDFGAEGLDSPSCELCGCTEDHACPGGCAWSVRYLNQNRMICTSCESLMIVFEINMAALRIWQSNSYIRLCETRSSS